jgi:REP-associated tyrosine transposase
MPDYHIPLFPDHSYHILGRAIGSEKIFKQEMNYPFLLKKYYNHIFPIADTFGYCLLPNHFHFLIRVKSMLEVEYYYNKMKPRKIFYPEIVSDFIMERFSNWLNSYTKAFNKTYDRQGSLFIDYLRRDEIQNNEQLGATIFYVHKNPVHHSYCKFMEKWRWSSYNTMLSNSKTLLLRNEVLELFGGKDGFIRYHQQPAYLKNAIIVE